MAQASSRLGLKPQGKPCRQRVVLSKACCQIVTGNGDVVSMNDLFSILAALGGTEVLLWTIGFIALAGAVAGGLALLRKPLGPDLRIEGELRLQLAARETEISDLHKRLGEILATAAAADGRRQTAEQWTERVTQEAESAKQTAASLREQLSLAESERAGLRAEVEKGNALLAEQRRFQTEAERELRSRHDQALAELRQTADRSISALRDQFKSLAADALAANSPEFLRLAGEKFAGLKASADGDLAQRQARIEALVRPLEEQLRSYQQRLQQSEATQQSSLGQVQEQLKALALQSESLSNETQRLRVVLSSNQARGRWGEETLRRVIEAAGLSAHCDFTEQIKEGEGKPDLVVRLPGGRVILVDSKVPDLAFLDALGTADEMKRRAALEVHAQNLKETIKDLAKRDYPKAFQNALDYVVLFLPAESLFSAALEGDPELILWAAGRHVLLATPASLIALLRSVSVSWQQYELSINNRQIGEAATELFDRVLIFLNHFERIRKGLEEASNAYNDTLTSYDRRLRPTGERLARLAGKPEDKTMPDIKSISIGLREVPRLPVSTTAPTSS